MSTEPQPYIYTKGSTIDIIYFTPSLLCRRHVLISWKLSFYVHGCCSILQLPDSLARLFETHLTTSSVQSTRNLMIRSLTHPSSRLVIKSTPCCPPFICGNIISAWTLPLISGWSWINLTRDSEKDIDIPCHGVSMLSGYGKRRRSGRSHDCGDCEDTRRHICVFGCCV